MTYKILCRLVNLLYEKKIISAEDVLFIFKGMKGAE